MLEICEYEELSLSDAIRELKNKLIEWEHLEKEEKEKKEDLTTEILALCETVILLLQQEEYEPVEKRIL
jgi:hypothetical protein